MLLFLLISNLWHRLWFIHSFINHFHCSYSAAVDFRKLEPHVTAIEWTGEKESGSFHLLNNFSGMAFVVDGEHNWLHVTAAACSHAHDCNRISIEVKCRFVTYFCHGKRWGADVVMNVSVRKIKIIENAFNNSSSRYIFFGFEFLKSSECKSY